MSATDQPPIPIDLIGDVASAECYIGLRLIDAVVASAPGLVVDVRWRPFQIDPDLPPEGQDRAAYLGDRSALQRRRARRSRASPRSRANSGSSFAFDKIKRQPNTLEAHRVVRLARDFDLEIRMVEALFDAFFLEGQDIGDRRVLVALAARTGLDGRRVAEFLAGDDDIEALRQELTGFRALGVEHVPRFIIAGKKTISGIVPAEDFADAVFAAVEEE